MKKIMYALFTALQIIIAILISTSIFFGAIDANIGLVLEKGFKYILIILNTIGLVLLAVTFIINKKLTFINAIVMVFACIYALIKYFDTNSIYAVNKIIWQFSYYSIIVNIASLLGIFAHIRVILKRTNDKTLPVGIYSKFQLICNYIYYTTASIIVAVIVVLFLLDKNTFESFTIYLIILAALTLCLVFILIVTDPIIKAEKYISIDLSYEKFKNEIEKIKRNNINKESKNYLNMIILNYADTIGQEEEEKYLNLCYMPNNSNQRVPYLVLETQHFINIGKYERAKVIINELKENRLALPYVEELNRLIMIKCDNKIIENVESYFPINRFSPLKSLMNCLNLMDYYNIRGNKEKAKEYALKVLNYNSDFTNYINQANLILKEDEK